MSEYTNNGSVAVLEAPASPPPEGWKEIEAGQESETPETPAAVSAVSEEEKARQELQERYLETEADAIAQEWADMERETGTRFYEIGRRCSAWLKAKLDSGSKRSDAIKVLKLKLLLACRGEDMETDINRAIQTYHAGELYGPTFKELPVGIQKPLATFVQRDAKTETWALVPDYAKQARKLYDKVCKDRKLTGADVREKVNAIKGKVNNAAKEKDVEAEAEVAAETPAAGTLSVKPASAACDLASLITEHDAPDDVMQALGQQETISKHHVVDILRGMRNAGRLADLHYIMEQAMKMVRELKKEQEQPTKEAA